MIGKRVQSSSSCSAQPDNVVNAPAAANAPTRPRPLRACDHSTAAADHTHRQFARLIRPVVVAPAGARPRVCARHGCRRRPPRRGCRSLPRPLLDIADRGDPSGKDWATHPSTRSRAANPFTEPGLSKRARQDSNRTFGFVDGRYGAESPANSAGGDGEGKPRGKKPKSSLPPSRLASSPSTLTKILSFASGSPSCAST